MKISIKNVGPLKDAELELGDITVLLGPPNSGKSYTLKSLYAQLVMLDETARDHIIKDAVKEIEIWEHVNYFTKNAAPNLILATVALYNLLASEDSGKIIERLKEDTRVGLIEVEVKNDIVTVTLGSSEILGIGTLANSLHERINSTLQKLFPVGEDTKIEVPEASLPKIQILLAESLKAPFEREMRASDERMGVISLFRVSSELENEESVKILFHLKTHIKRDGRLWKEIQRIRKDLPSNLRLEDIDELLESLFGDVTPRSRRFHIISPYIYMWRSTFREHAKLLLSRFIEHLCESISKQLKNIYGEAFNIQSALFIPFGRSPFVYQLDTISNDPSLWHGLIEIYENNLPFYSYIHHLSKGRGRLLSDKVDEELVNIFNPVLQGELMFDRTTKRLRYKKWNSVDISINQASALAGEVSGIMLPVLSIPPNSYLIIEEPEAQLHYSAQILMALVLAGLSKGFNHKIIFSTHSDVLAITLAYLKELEYDENRIIKLIQELLRTQAIDIGEEDARPLAEAVSRAKDLDIRFYYYDPKPDGTVEVLEKSSKDILREVPGITIITDILASWVLSL